MDEIQDNLECELENFPSLQSSFCYLTVKN